MACPVSVLSRNQARAAVTPYVGSGLKELVVFVLFLLVLLFKPSGLLGKSRM